MTNEKIARPKPSGLLFVLLLLFAAFSLPTNAGSSDTDGDGLLDSFELAHQLNPNRADTDGNGLLDPAEDPDHDGLSNLAEQAFSTDPTKADTDGNGTGDALEDANNDGVPNWKQQDDRAVPDPTTPPLGDPNSDFTCYRPGKGSTGKCVGDPNGNRLVAIYGDSHSGQWIAALQLVAQRRHWRLVSYAKSACPSVHVDVHLGLDDVCRDYRAASEKAMRLHPPDLVILANSYQYTVTKSAWKNGLKATLQALPKASRIIVLADTPNFTKPVGDIPTCLEQHLDDVGACEAPASKVFRPAFDQAAVSLVGAANFISMNPLVCPYLLCSVVTGPFLMYRDPQHITVAYVQQLAPALGALVARKMP